MFPLKSLKSTITSADAIHGASPGCGTGLGRRVGNPDVRQHDIDGDLTPPGQPDCRDRPVSVGHIPAPDAEAPDDAWARHHRLVEDVLRRRLNDRVFLEPTFDRVRPAERAGFEAVSAPRGRILLVDDEGDILVLLEALLSGAGWEVVGKAERGRGALELAAEHRPDVALVDYMMPGVDGLTLASRLKERDPDCVVVIFSARDVQTEVDASPTADWFASKRDLQGLLALLSRIAAQRRLGVES
jgi:CheY-like chemotaxis protein